MDSKVGYNATDQSALNRAINSAQVNFSGVADSLFGASCRLIEEIKKPRGFLALRRLSRFSREKGAQELLVKLRIPIDRIADLPHQPDRLFADKIICAHQQLYNALVGQNTEGAKRALVKMVVLTKMQRAHWVCEELRRYTVRGEIVPLKQVALTTISLMRLLERRPVFPDNIPDEYQTAYEPVERHVKILASGLERRSKQGLDLAQRTVMYAKLRIFLDSFDLIEIMKRLPE